MTHPLRSFQKIYVINLASRSDRRAEMAEQFARIGLSLDAPNVHLFSAIRPADAGAFPSIGARGCFLSHLNILREAADAGLERILIVEDDLNFSDDFAARAPGWVSSALSGGNMMLYGSGRLETPPAGVGCVEIPPTAWIETTHFVGMQGACIGALAAYLAAMLERAPGHAAGGPMHVDGAYSWFRSRHPDVRTVMAVPELGYQRASRTDIHDLRWFDRAPVIRGIVSEARKLRRK